MKAKMILFVISGLLVLSNACNKEILPDKEMLEGIWVTKEASLNSTIEFTLQELFIEYGSGTDEHYFYNIKNSTMYLYPEKMNDPDKFSTHIILLNSKTDVLKIKGLNSSISDSDGFAVFVRQ